ncbi:peptidase, M20/M25/M40 family [Cooperia oncophora]
MYTANPCLGIVQADLESVIRRADPKCLHAFLIKGEVLVSSREDVQPAAKEDGWRTEPFTLFEKGFNLFNTSQYGVHDKLFGRGASDDKGPVLCWMHAIEMLQKHKIDIPVNVKFCFEAMEESGSLGLEELLTKNKNKFLAGVDFTCISDSYWLGTTKPCLTHGLRGICSFNVEVTGIQQDLHSGVFGGVV